MEKYKKATSGGGGGINARSKEAGEQGGWQRGGGKK
jgi:hypothetical protein